MDYPSYADIRGSRVRTSGVAGVYRQVYPVYKAAAARVHRLIRNPGKLSRTSSRIIQAVVPVQKVRQFYRHSAIE